MRYVCRDCGSTFEEPETIVPIGTNEMLDCCPLCNSVSISKDKEFNELENALNEADIDLDEIIEKVNDAKCLIHRRVATLDTQTNVNDILTKLDRIQDHVLYIKKNLKGF